jgi:hypothetical protein
MMSQIDLEVSEEKIKMRKVNERQTPSDGKSSHCLWQGELKIIKTRYDYHLMIMKSPKPATDNRFKK